MSTALPSRCRFLQHLTVGRGERLDKRVRQMLRRHLDEIAIEAREQVPVLRLVRGARLAAACGTLEARLQLRRVEPVEEFHERRARRLRGGGLVQLGLEDRFAQPLYRVEPAEDRKSVV